LATIKKGKKLKEGNKEYIIQDEENNLINSINEDIKKSIFNKKHNLSGEISDKGGINIYKTYSSVLDVQSNQNPIIKLNMQTVHFDNNPKNRKLVLSQVKDGLFEHMFLICAIFTILTLGLAIYQIIEFGFNEKMNFLIMPAAGILIYIAYELISDFLFSELVNKTETIMKNLKIEYKKL